MAGGADADQVDHQRRILYVDPFSAFGHNALNTVFIERLVAAGFIVDAAMRQSYFGQLALPAGVKRLPIPDRYFLATGPVANRFRQLALLRFVKRHLFSAEYDYVLFSYFDEIALALSRFPGRLLLVVHSNVADLDHPIKGFFVRWVARRARLVVFNEVIKQRCAEFGLHDVQVEPLGLSRVVDVPEALRPDALHSIDARLTSNRFDHLVFVPSGSKYSDTFLAKAIRDPLLLDFLRARRIGLVVRDVALKSDSDQVILLRRHLSAFQYAALFGASACVVLSYPQSFVYRVSALLFECFSASKPCVVSDIESFRVFERHFTYDAFFRDTHSLIAAIGRTLSREIRAGHPYRELDALQPTFRVLAGNGRPLK